MKTFKILLVAAVIGFSAYSIHLIYRNTRLVEAEKLSIMLVQNPLLTADSRHILKAYKSVLDEEGVPYTVVSDTIFTTLDVDLLIRKSQAIIFPDAIAQSLPREVELLIKEYLGRGGNVMVVYDAGTKDVKGAFLRQALFTDITGINYATYDKLRENAYTMGYLRVEPENVEFLQIPYGKILEGRLMGGYAYGRLMYPIAKNEIRNIGSSKIYADVISEMGEKFPAVVMNRYGKGRVLYVNLPLGHLKSYSDDLPMRGLLRTFLFRESKIPHLLNTRYGKAGLVINWHIDSSIDWKSFPYMVERNYLRKSLEYSFHITAGDFRDTPGDGLGFDACGKGRSYVEALLGYGEVGSHGGWAHNWFANNISNGKFGKEEIYDNIAKNSKCLESVTGKKVLEYSAPNGTHPQPVMTEVLGELGIQSYYYTGDTGSAPNRTFLNGEMIANEVFAFPIMTFGKNASLLEIKRAARAEQDVARWFIETIDYVIRNRTVRLVYSHPYDIQDFPTAFSELLDYAEMQQNRGRLEVKSMSYFTGFLQRFLGTKHEFNIRGATLEVSLENPAGLEGVTVAVPREKYLRPDSRKLRIEEDEDYYYISVEEPVLTSTITVRMHE